MSKKSIASLLKTYSENLDYLTPEECALLHQHATDQLKLFEEVKKVTYDLLINKFGTSFPKVLNGRTASINVGKTRAPSSITWAEVLTYDLPIEGEVFSDCAVLKMELLKKEHPSVYKKLTAHEWFINQSTESSGFISWSKPIKKIEK